MEREAQLVDGALRVEGGRPQLLVLKEEILGDVRLEFDVRQEGDYLNDASCFIGAARDREGGVVLSSGYEFKHAGYTNTMDMLTRRGENLYRELADPLVSGRTYRVRVEKVGATLRMQVDGKEIFTVEDAEPIEDLGHHVLGLFGWRAETYWDNIVSAG